MNNIFAMRKITATEVRSITWPGLHRAGETFFCVKPSGRRSWIQQVVIGGRRIDIGLGAYPAVSLAKARRKATEYHATIAMPCPYLAICQSAICAALWRNRSPSNIRYLVA